MEGKEYTRPWNEFQNICHQHEANTIHCHTGNSTQSNFGPLSQVASWGRSSKARWSHCLAESFTIAHPWFPPVNTIQATCISVVVGSRKQSCGPSCKDPGVGHCHLVGPVGVTPEAENQRQFSDCPDKMANPGSEVFRFLHVLNQTAFLWKLSHRQDSSKVRQN